MIIGCKLATTEYGAETFFQSQLVIHSVSRLRPYNKILISFAESFAVVAFAWLSVTTCVY